MRSLDRDEPALVLLTALQPHHGQPLPLERVHGQRDDDGIGIC